MIYVIYALIIISLFFAFAGVIGMLRMPDAYCRMQSSTNVGTLGTLGVMIAAVLYSAIYLHDGGMAVKSAVIGIFLILTNPIAGHALAKGAYHHGVRLSKKTIVDKYGEDMEND